MPGPGQEAAAATAAVLSLWQCCSLTGFSLTACEQCCQVAGSTALLLRSPTAFAALHLSTVAENLLQAAAAAAHCKRS